MKILMAVFQSTTVITSRHEETATCVSLLPLVTPTETPAIHRSHSHFTIDTRLISLGLNYNPPTCRFLLHFPPQLEPPTRALPQLSNNGDGNGQ